MKTSLYLATARGLAVIKGSEGIWRGTLILKDTQIQCVAVGPSPGGLLYCGTFGQGVLRSSDQGATWSASSGLQNAKVTAIACSGGNNLYAGTGPSAVYRSGDGGETWHEAGTLQTLASASLWSFPPRPETHHVQAILPGLAHPARLHVAVEAGALLCSDDAGATWRDRVPGGPRDSHTLAIALHDTARLISAAGDGCFESRDDGSTWRKLQEGLEHHYCWSIAISAANPEVMLLSASSGAYGAHAKKAAHSCVYRRNGNEAWQRITDGLPSPEGLRIPVLVASRAEPGVFYFAAEGLVYKSSDEGLHWQELAIQWDEAKAIGHSLNVAIAEEPG